MTFYEAILNIDIPNEMGCYDESDGVTPDTDYYIDKVYDLARKMNIEIDHAYGVSQLCFIIKDSDTVLKVAFNGMMEEWSEYNPETEEYDIWKEDFNPFDIDYCSKAYEIYDLAYEAGIEEFFAKMGILGKTSSNDIIWTQEYVTPLSVNNSSSKKASEDSLKKAKKLENKRYIPFETEWIALALDLYGENKSKQLLAFLDENDIHDLHHGNYGYTKDGYPMILDYSSWD